MAEREHYEVDVHGIKHTFLLTAEDAKRRYPGAKRVEDPAAGSDAEKLLQKFNEQANARPESEAETASDTEVAPDTESNSETPSEADETASGGKARTAANKSRAAANKTA